MARYSAFGGTPRGRFGVIDTGGTIGRDALSVLLGVFGDLSAPLVVATLVPVTANSVIRF